MISSPQYSLDGMLSGYESISLDAMENVALLDRLDTKFTFRVDELPGLLDQVRPYYSLLGINDVRAHRYETLYFDTPALALYAQHHNGIYARHKVRYRRYVDSGLCFLEVKTKTNQGRTLKRRISRPCIDVDIDGSAKAFLQTELPRLSSTIRPALWVGFRRLTLVHKEVPERLTIDLDLSYRTQDSSFSLPGLVIAEVKQDRAVRRSAFVDVTRQRRIWEGSMSKYCFGIVALYPEAKCNRFKERFRETTKLAA